MPTSATTPPQPGGWRAERLVDEHTLEPLRGWVLIARAADAADPDQHEALARQAHLLGTAAGDRDLELCAPTQIGVALIDQGRITEGMTFHDEAMAGALAGEGELDTVVFTACEMMTSYSRCAQYQRMARWIWAADRFVKRYGCPYLNASCRTHYGEVLFATGDWVRAEKELHAALRLSENSLPAVQAKALTSLAELRLAQGRVAEACQVMLARGERLQGRALAAASDSAAKRHLNVALRAFNQLEMPLEAARTRLLLARALRRLDPEVAEAEARAALAVFENLGAVTDAEATSTLLRELETRPASEPARQPIQPA